MKPILYVEFLGESRRQGFNQENVIFIFHNLIIGC